LTSSSIGQPATFTAVVSGAAAGVGLPSGVVRFLDSDVVMATGLLANGEARVTISSLAPGFHQIIAFYPGAGFWGPALSNPLSQVVTGGIFGFEHPLRPKR
jgi:hypothetical protein